MAEVPNIPFLSVQWLMDKTGQSRKEMLSQTLPGLEIPLYGDARGRECFGFPESYSEDEAWNIVFFELRTSKKHVFQKAQGDGNPAADSWVKSVFISRNDVIKILERLNILEPGQPTAPQKQDGSGPKSRKPRSDTGRIAETAKAVIAYIELGIENPTAEEVTGKVELLFKHPIGRTTVQNVLDRLINEVIPDKKPI